MAEKINDLVKNLLDGMHNISKAETIVGEPTQAGSATVIPVHRLRVGFVAGAIGGGGHATDAEGKSGGQALGGTAQIEPVAVLAVGPDGKPRLLAVEGEAANTWQGLLRDTPELFNKLARKLADRLESLATEKLAAAAKAKLDTKSEAQLPANKPAELPEKK
ncbi:MAG: spore germination protein GerW family protein [Byssovorax sp.]